MKTLKIFVDKRVIIICILVIYIFYIFIADISKKWQIIEATIAEWFNS